MRIRRRRIPADLERLGSPLRSRLADPWRGRARTGSPVRGARGAPAGTRCGGFSARARGGAAGDLRGAPVGRPRPHARPRGVRRVRQDGAGRPALRARLRAAGPVQLGRGRTTVRVLRPRSQERRTSSGTLAERDLLALQQARQPAASRRRPGHKAHEIAARFLDYHLDTLPERTSASPAPPAREPRPAPSPPRGRCSSSARRAAAPASRRRADVYDAEEVPAALEAGRSALESGDRGRGRDPARRAGRAGLEGGVRAEARKPAGRGRRPADRRPAGSPGGAEQLEVLAELERPATSPCAPRSRPHGRGSRRAPECHETLVAMDVRYPLHAGRPRPASCTSRRASPWPRTPAPTP